MTQTQTQAQALPTPLLVMDRLSLADHGRPVFNDVSLELTPGTLGVVCGPSGSGRSCVLLAAVGRVRGLAGAGRFAELDLVRQTRAVRKRTAVARVADLVVLEPQLRVAESIVERSLTEGVSAAAAERAVARAEALLDCTFRRAALVSELSRLDQGRLALALAVVRPAEVVIFDDVDRDLNPDDQRRLFDALTMMARTGPAVLASTTTALTIPDHAVVVTLREACI